MLDIFFQVRLNFGAMSLAILGVVQNKILPSACVIDSRLNGRERQQRLAWFAFPHAANGRGGVLQTIKNPPERVLNLSSFKLLI